MKRHAGLVMFPTWRLVRNQPGYAALFWLFFRGVLSSIKVSLKSQLYLSPLYSSSIFRTLLCFLAWMRFCSSSILIFKTRIRSTHKNEKWSKQITRCRRYRLYYYGNIFVLVQIVHTLFARKSNNNILYAPPIGLPCRKWHKLYIEPFIVYLNLGTLRVKGMWYLVNLQQILLILSFYMFVSNTHRILI